MTFNEGRRAGFGLRDIAKAVIGEPGSLTLRCLYAGDLMIPIIRGCGGVLQRIGQGGEIISGIISII